MHDSSASLVMKTILPLKLIMHVTDIKLVDQRRSQHQHIWARASLAVLGVFLVLGALSKTSSAEPPRHLQRLLTTRFCHKCNLNKANLANQNLQGVRLTQTKLKRADLRGADLKFAILYNVNLKKADLTGADLTGATLQKVNIKGAILDGAKMPTNFRPDR